MVLCVAASDTIPHEVLGHRPQPVVFGLIWLRNRNSLWDNGSKGLTLLHFTQSPPESLQLSYSDRSPVVKVRTAFIAH